MIRDRRSETPSTWSGWSSQTLTATLQPLWSD